MTAVTPSNAVATPSDIVQSPLPRLKITEIFTSLQGEADTAGWPTVFVRLTGCPLRCQYCDTAYAFHGGTWWDIDDIVAEVLAQGVRHVCVTGGEPLAQKRCLVLLQKLCDAGMDVSLETSGALDVSAVDPRVSRVVDIKTPGSADGAQPLGKPAAADRTRPDQVRHLQPRGLRLGQGPSGRARSGQALHRVLLAQQGRDHRAAAGRLDCRRPAAGALPDAVA